MKKGREKSKIGKFIKGCVNDFRNGKMLDKEADDFRFNITYDFHGDDLDMEGMRKVNYIVQPHFRNR